MSQDTSGKAGEVVNGSILELEVRFEARLTALEAELKAGMSKLEKQLGKQSSLEQPLPSERRLVLQAPHEQLSSIPDTRVEICEDHRLLVDLDCPLHAASEREMPESLFNYCIETLTFSARPHAEPVWLYLFLVCMLQQGMVMIVLQMNLDDLTDVMFTGNGHKSFSLREGCQREENVYTMLDGDLMIRSLSAVFGIIIVCVFINADMHNMRRASFPDAGAPLWLRLTTTIFWFLQAVMLPANVCMEIARLLALSQTPMDIVMNTLAATFILEIDELLFVALLTNSEKENYFAMAARSGSFEAVDATGPLLGWFRFSCMAFQYFYIRHHDFPHRSYLEISSDIVTSAYAYLALYFAEVSVQAYRARRRPRAGKMSGILVAIACGFLSAVVGFLYWVHLDAIGSNFVEFGTRDHKHLFACMSRMAASAKKGHVV